MFEDVWLCPICKSAPEQHKFFDMVPGKVWNNNRQEIKRLYYGICKACGIVFQFSRIADQNKFYMQGDYRKAIQGHGRVDGRILTEQANRVENLMPFMEFETVNRVLDIGSSTGMLLETLAEKYDCEVLGIEPGEAQRMSAAAPAFSDLDLLDESYWYSFDLITMIHVLEHLKDPADYLVQLHNFIADGGYLMIEVPNLYTENTLLTPHTVSFTPETLTNTLAFAGWKVEWLEEYHGLKRKYPIPANILVLARQGNVRKIPSVDIDEVFDQYRAGMEALRNFTQKERNTGEV
jgi:SAM-dependent methyltransferase